METDDITLQNGEANPNGAQTTPQNEGNQATKPQVDKTNEGTTYSQKQLDDIAAKARGAAERETKKKLLAQLGLKEDEMDKLNAFKEAYEASLSDEEKRNNEISELKATNLQLTQDLEEKDYTIKALIELTGKDESDVEKIVKMAKGLKTDENSVEDAIKEVISMIGTQTQPTTPSVTGVNPNMPISNEIQQPSTVIVDVQANPFKAGQINLTEQGKLIRTNPELAKKLAKEAGVNLKF